MPSVGSVMMRCCHTFPSGTSQSPKDSPDVIRPLKDSDSQTPPPSFQTLLQFVTEMQKLLMLYGHRDVLMSFKNYLRILSGSWVFVAFSIICALGQ